MISNRNLINRLHGKNIGMHTLLPMFYWTVNDAMINCRIFKI
ncbi:MAG: hypothetical protein ACTSWX_00230 [Promethearchaeota archaeon]